MHPHPILTPSCRTRPHPYTNGKEEVSCLRLHRQAGLLEQVLSSQNHTIPHVSASVGRGWRGERREERKPRTQGTSRHMPQLSWPVPNTAGTNSPYFHTGNWRSATEPWPRMGGDHRQEEALWLVGPDDPEICTHGQWLHCVSSPSEHLHRQSYVTQRQGKWSS